MPKRYVLALVIIAVVFFGGIALLVSLIAGGDSGEKKPTQTSQTTEITETKNNYPEDTTAVSFTVYGKVVGEEERRAIRISVSQFERRADVLKGYDQHVTASQVTPNTQSAYEAFLYALKAGNFTSIDKDFEKTDVRTQCVTGKRYEYQVKYLDGSDRLSWSTTCSGDGTFAGNRRMVQDLFQSQIPEYSAFVRDVRL